MNISYNYVLCVNSINIKLDLLITPWCTQKPQHDLHKKPRNIKQK